MYGLTELKPTIAVTDSTVECPCAHCGTVAERVRRGESLRQEKFLCNEHRIYISPSTFEYDDEFENLLWRDEVDRSLLNSVKCVKRETRFARDNSEDALTWNIIRYLERSGQLSNFLGSVLSTPITDPKVIYWSYSQDADGTAEAIQHARQEFGELDNRGSEPDVIIDTPEAMVWIEAKLGSANDTQPSNLIGTKKYLSGGDKWFRRAFRSEYRDVAVANKRYELMRLWLLGTWVAAQAARQFCLLNLVRQQSHEAQFRRHIADLPNAIFDVITWENIYGWLSTQRGGGEDRQRVLQYMANKGGGYIRGRLVAAFPTLRKIATLSVSAESTAPCTPAEADFSG